jgi:putative ABC transport system permease protein
LFEALSLVDPDTLNLTGKHEPERLEAMLVSANLFDTLGIQPAIGRTFMAGEDESGRNRVVVISHELWKRKFNADPSLMGQTITLNNEAHTLVGVLPAGFRFPKVSSFDLGGGSTRPDVFKPKVFKQQELNERMGQFNYGVIARLKPSVTPTQAVAELDVIAAHIVQEAGINMELRAVAIPWQDWIVGNSRRGLFVLLSAIGSVLLIACLNLAMLSLVRVEKRSYESAIRTALGANKIRLLRQALVEILLIALIGGVLGVVIASMGLDTLIRLAPADIPRLDEVCMDHQVLLFAVSLTFFTALLFGLLPVWRMTQGHPKDVLTAGAHTVTTTKRGLRVRSALVTAEVALGVVLLVLAGLLLSSFANVLYADKGFHAPTVLATDIMLPKAKYANHTQRVDFYQALLTRLASTPSITSAAIVSALPLQGETWVDAASVPGDTRAMLEQPSVNVRFISEAYFRTMGIPLLSGRTFNDSDRSRKVAVISKRLAHILWPEQNNVLGYRFLHNNNQEFEVIGVAGDVHVYADERPVAMLYRSYWEISRAQTVIVTQAAGNPFSIAGSVRAAVHSLDADLPISTMRTMQEILDDSVAQRRFQMLLASAFAATALLLAGLGIFGVVSCLVTQRTREIGIRMAFGARPRNILQTVLQQGMIPVIIGIAIGMAGALALGRILASLLYDVSPHDPKTMFVVIGMLLMVALTACFIPAQRAAKIDPMEALRYE